MRYAETDAMGVGYHGAYLPWLELARTQWLREHALSYRDLEASGTHLPVVELACRYRAPTRYDDDLVVEAQARPHRRRGIAFSYRVVRPVDGALVATAETRHAAVDGAGRLRALPRLVREALEQSGDSAPAERDSPGAAPAEAADS